MAAQSWQQTLKSPIHCTGIGLHSGHRVTLTLRPAPVGSGIVFRRTDLAEGKGDIPARWDHVVDTRLCTVLANAQGATVGTVEHLMAALAGCGIDNALVEVDGGEVPIMDGSADPFVFLVESAGVAVQEAPRRVLRVLNEVRVTDGAKSAVLSPSPISGYHVEIAFGSAAIGRQIGVLRLTEGSFKAEVAKARTFGFLHEVEMLRKAGLARGGSLDNAIVLDGDRVLNPGGLRFEDEFVRHKILDAVGDLYLSGAGIVGQFHGTLSGHELNNRLLRSLFADPAAYRRDEAPAVTPAERPIPDRLPVRRPPRVAAIA